MEGKERGLVFLFVIGVREKEKERSVERFGLAVIYEWEAKVKGVKWS